MSIKSRKKVDCEPYSRLAEIYDFVMSHLDYKRWTDYIESVFSHFDLNPSDILDVACGTGTMALELHSRGYNTSGIDESWSMVEVARVKSQKAGVQIDLSCGDIRDLKKCRSFEAVLCLYDSLNYLMEIEEVKKALKSIRQILDPAGIFIFDICMERNSLLYFRDYTSKGKGDGFSYSRHSFYDPETKIQNNHFKIGFDRSDETFVEMHRQRIYSKDEIEKAVRESEFDILGIFDDFSLRPASKNSDRIHFVLR